MIYIEALSSKLDREYDYMGDICKGDICKDEQLNILNDCVIDD